MSLATETMAVYNNLQQPPPPPLSVNNNNNNKYSNNNNENNNGPVPSVGGVGINGQIIGDPNNGGVENGMVRGWGQYLWRQYVAGAQGNSRNYNNNGGAEEDLWSGGDESPQHGAPPGFWDRSYETDLKYVDLDEFLSENGVSMDGLNSSLTPATHNSHLNSTTNGHNNNNNVHSTHTSTNNSSTHSPTSNSPTVGGLGSIVTNGGPGMGPLGAGLGSLGVGLGAVGVGLGSVGGLVGVSNGLVRTKRERRSPSPSDCCPDSPEEADSSSLSIASSGNSRHHSFDPRTRAFSDEELRPQPMVKKSRKQYVPDDLKDDKYWARRRKNNMAAKRSRDARRIKENQIALRAGYLEKENIGLRQELDRLRKENHLLRDKLSKYADV